MSQIRPAQSDCDTGDFMNRTLLTFALASLFATGCARANLAPVATAASESATKAEVKATAEKVEEAAPASEAKASEAAETTGARKAGDFIVYRFSGSFRKAPITLTERVIERRAAMLTVDITVEAGDTKRQLRVKIDEASAVKNDVVAVSVLENGAETPAGIEAYEALLAETALAADENQAMLGAEDAMLDVGGAPIPVRTTSYRVRVGKKQATLRTVESEGFAWGDLGGEITASNGKVLYRAEVVELGHSDPAQGTATAQVDKR
jgi:hypothetical protein